MFENEKLMVGEHFTYEGIEWICLDILDIIDGNYLAITAQVWQELPFVPQTHPAFSVFPDTEGQSPEDSE